jgi:hypothetical protein
LVRLFVTGVEEILGFVFGAESHFLSSRPDQSEIDNAPDVARKLKLVRVKSRQMPGKHKFSVMSRQAMPVPGAGEAFCLLPFFFWLELRLGDY